MVEVKERVFEGPEFNDNGKLIHYKDEETGLETWTEHNDEGDLIHTRNSIGFEAWYVYDGDSREIFYTNTYGEEEWAKEWTFNNK
jgi:YD repeat-containing protein